MPARGISRVRLNLKRAFDDADGMRTNRAVYAILSQGAAMAQTMTPIDTGNLVNSQYAPRIEKTKGKTSGVVGYTAKYAEWVHEAPGTLKGQPRAHFGKTRAGVEFGGGTQVGYYWDPNAEPGFLRKGFEELKPAIPQILRSIYGV